MLISFQDKAISEIISLIVHYHLSIRRRLCPRDGDRTIYSLPSSAKAKNVWCPISLSHMCFHGNDVWYTHDVIVKNYNYFDTAALFAYLAYFSYPCSEFFSYN